MQTAKNQLAVALVLTNNKYSPGLMSFIGQMLPIIWAGDVSSTFSIRVALHHAPLN
jgi:hypothetical protein